jgi:hypothetical protein
MKHAGAAAAFIATVILGGCGEAPKTYGQGYSDGYAVGYNTACKIRTTMIYGDWDSKEYSRGYADGNTAGTLACLRKRGDV